MLPVTLFALLLAGGTQEMMIPEGTIIPVVLNETLNTAKIQDNDPVLFSLADDMRAAGHRGPILIPRGSSVVGRVVKSDRAGHFIGRSELDIRLQEIVTPAGVVYDGLSAKIVDLGKAKGEKGEIRADGVIKGPTHRVRDTILLLFPPTTLFQLMATPKRGPDVVIPVETRIYVKLMSPIYVETQTAAVGTTAPHAAIPLPQPVPQMVPQFAPQAVPQVVPSLSAANLEILVAPVALYPDAILRDLLQACAHPPDLVQANQWMQQSRDVSGGLSTVGYNPNWDPSVKAITGYPELLQRLNADIDWAARLGTTYLTRPSDVFGAIQRIRSQAHTLTGAHSGLTLPVAF